MDTATLTPDMKRTALRPLREDWSFTTTGGDEWRVTMGHWFGVAEVLYHAGAALPPEWQFRHGMRNDDPIGAYHADDAPCPLHPEECDYCPVSLSDGSLAYECDCHEERHYVPFLDAGESGIAMLRYAGRVIDRLCTRLKRAGKDY